MSQDPDDASSSFPSLPCNELVYRLAIRSRDVDQDRPKLWLTAFIRRPPKDEQDRGDEDGLSVNPSHSCNLEDAKGGFGGVIKRVYGIGTLHTGWVRDLGLEIIQDEDIHALIQGLPYEREDPAEANRLAGALAELSRLVWPERD
jgi:hypothetical protein